MIRKWERQTDNGAVHVLGNGHIVVYENGPEIIQIVGAPYSADSLGGIEIPGIDHCVSERLPKTNIWIHRLDNESVITDVVDSKYAGFVREIEATCDFIMNLKIENGFSVFEKQNNDRIAFYTPNGTKFYGYKTDHIIYHRIMVCGAAFLEEESESVYRIHIKKGKSKLVVANDFAVAEHLLQTPFEQIIERSSIYWKDFVSGGREVPEEVSELCENLAIMIKAQQGADGGILAGYPYHLAYIRDQYGTVRGLLKMGYIKEAELVMYYYLTIFYKYGTLQNAQSIGEHGVFHIHENDKVEITGYISIMPFDIYAYSRNQKFLKDMMPMIRWALDCQAKELKNGMLPFNGDETYIAGGFLPRTVMYHGSAEATMLFAEGIRLYQKYTGDERYAAYYKEISKNYIKNFCPNGRYITNVPELTPIEEYPASRHGICENCKSVLTTLIKTSNNRYVCKDCIQKQTLSAYEPQIYELAASKLAPIYMGSPLVPDDIIENYLNEMVDAYHMTGEMPSGCPAGECVGYDYGLLLYALAVRRHPSAKEFYSLTLDVVDETGAWCEYYKNGIACATRCRPWESGINIEAVLTYLEQEKNVGR